MSIEYIAGLYDGEGSFSVSIVIRPRKNGHGINITPTMSLALKYGQHALNELVKEFGGTINKAGKNADSRMWVMRKRELLLAAASRLLPHLIIKKDTCAKFINILHTYPNILPTRDKPWFNTWDRDACIKITTLSYDLNQKGIHYDKPLDLVISQIHSAFDRKHGIVQ